MHLHRCSQHRAGCGCLTIGREHVSFKYFQFYCAAAWVKAAQYNRLKRIQSYLMPLPQLQGVPFGSARDTLYYSSCFTCLFKDKHHHFCTRRYTAKRSDFHEEKSNHSGFAKEDDEHPKVLNITHPKSSRMHRALEGAFTESQND